MSKEITGARFGSSDCSVAELVAEFEDQFRSVDDHNDIHEFVELVCRRACRNGVTFIRSIYPNQHDDVVVVFFVPGFKYAKAIQYDTFGLHNNVEEFKRLCLDSWRAIEAVSHVVRISLSRARSNATDKGA